MTRSLVSLLRRRARETPERLAYAFLGGDELTHELTFAELERQARALGARLQSLGAKGERVLLALPTGPDYTVAFFGCLAAGAVAVTSFPPRNNRNLSHLESVLADARPTVGLTTAELYRKMRKGFAENSRLARLRWLKTGDVEEAEADTWSDPEVTRESLAFLQYTSASTSDPKGVMVSHGNLLHNQALMKEVFGHERDSVIVSWLPFFHDMGLIGNVMASLYNGACCYLMAPVDFLKKPRRWLEAISRYGGTFSGGPDFALRLCVDKIPPAKREGLDLSTWRAAFNGSEPVRESTLRGFARAFAPCGFRQEALFPCYGLAEHTLFATGTYWTEPAERFSRSGLEQNRARPAGDEPSVDLVSCGNTVLDARVVIAADGGRRCEEGEIGEIWLSGHSVAMGYWRKPELTESTFRARLDDGDGPFLRTGDLGFLSRGRLFITGRIKDLIILRGRNLIPQDIEKVVEYHVDAFRPSRVAAVSVEHGGAERLILAAEVRRRARKSLDGDVTIERVRAVITAEFGVDLSGMAILEPNRLPKTTSGKIQRARIGRDFLAGELSALAQWRDPKVFGATHHGVPVVELGSARRLEDWLTERLAARLELAPEKVNRHRAVASYGLDSVLVVSLAGEVEEAFGVEIPEELFFRGMPSLRDVARRIRDRVQGSPEPEKRSPVPIARHAGRGNGGDPRVVRRRAAGPAPTGEPPPPPPTVVAAAGNGGEASHREHPFRRCVNPELGRLLAQMAMDKTFVRGEGSWLWDRQGRRYLDFLAQYGALPFGFNPRRIWAALEAARDAGEPSFVQPSYLDAAGELAERLLAAAPPGLAWVTFGNSGAEANEAAIKLCRSTTGRHDVLAAANGFHGKTMGALSATDREHFQKAFGLPVRGFDYVPYGDLEALRQALSTGRYAGFLVEPLQGEGGIVEPPAGYLRLAAKACRDARTLLIADEVQTGLGRTGAMFACGAEGFTPDVLTVAKALGGGLMPIGACLSTTEAYNKDFALKHTSTFAGNALACRAALATLDWLEEDEGALIDAVVENGARLKEGLHELRRRFPRLIREVRGRGYLLGICFGLDRHNVPQGLMGYLGEQDLLTAMVVSHLLHFEGVRVGYTLNQDGVMRIEPPLTATWGECRFFLEAVGRVLEVLERGDLATLTAHVTGAPRRAEPEVALHSAATFTARPENGGTPVECGPDDGRFAFLVHPLALTDYADLDATLGPLSTEQLEKLSSAIADNFDPFVVGEARVVGDNGKSAYGEFILVPRLAGELKEMDPCDALSEIRAAARLGRERGARIIGLGAYTSVVTHGGLGLKSEGLPPLTTGNSYTALAASEAVRLAASQRGWKLSDRSVAVVGAGGSVGQALTLLLARNCGRLILLGNPAHPEESQRILQQVVGGLAGELDLLARGVRRKRGTVAGRLARLGLEPSSDRGSRALAGLGAEVLGRTDSVVVSVDAREWLPEADVVVYATSDPGHLLDKDRLRAGAVVCDVSRPPNVDAGLLGERSDVMVVDGGVVQMPGASALGFNLSLDEGQVYACMAETMMLAAEQRYRHTSLGYDAELDQVLAMERLARELGFRVVLRVKAAGRPVQAVGDQISQDLPDRADLIFSSGNHLHQTT